jgi:hypothetical protein
MKVRILFFSICFLALYTTNCSAQVNTNRPQSIISARASIRTYYDNETLKSMGKGELVELYIERMKVIVRILPKMGLATKPGVTATDLAIPDTSENRKTLESQRETTQECVDNTIVFLRKMLPFCDKEQLITTILFYEDILKSLKEIEID